MAPTHALPFIVMHTEPLESRQPPPSETSNGALVTEILTRLQPEKVPYPHRIFVNRTLRLDSVNVVGFDMDYTLAHYTIELKHLAARLTLRRMTDVHGYPAEVRDIGYDPEFPIRGTVIDKRTGNVFKMDAHKHVERVFHGMRELTKEERHSAYRKAVIRLHHDRYALMDTLFALPEVYLYCRLVDLIEKRAPRLPLRPADYRKIYDDIRESIDAVHRDGSLKTEVVAEMSRYIHRDPHLPLTLESFLASGKSLFLLTNSALDYTDAVMRYLLDDAQPARPSWQDYFDVIVVAAGKPGFFTGRTPFQQVRPRFEPVDSLALRFEPGCVYQGGNIHDFERLAGIGGDSVIYVGDHIYGDMLRSKKASAWRTVMVVPELEQELLLIEELRDRVRERDDLDARRLQLDEELIFQLMLRDKLEDERRERTNGSSETLAALLEAVQVSETRIGALRRAIEANLIKTRELNAEMDDRFNPHWGMLLKSSREHSAFGRQVEDYACLYTSRVSNFRYYSPLQYFRTPRDLLPHERLELFGL